MSDAESASAPSLSLRDTPSGEADIEVSTSDAGATVTKLHQALFRAGLELWLLEALQEIPGDRRGEMRAALLSAGVNALDCFYSDLVVSTALALEWAQEDLDDDQRVERARQSAEELFEVSRQLGTGATPLGYRTSIDDIWGGPLVVLQSSEVLPTVEVTLTGEFVEQPPEQREQVLQLIEQLGLAADVELVTTGMAQGCIDEKHADDVPGHVTSDLNPRANAHAHARETAETARDRLSTEHTPAGVLRTLHASPTGRMTYRALRREMALERSKTSLDRLKKAAERLETEHDLVDRVERPDGTKEVSIRCAGEFVVEHWDTDDEIRRRASTSFDDIGVRDMTPKISLPSRVIPQAHEDPPAGPASAAAPAQPSAPQSPSASSSSSADSSAQAAVSPDQPEVSPTVTPQAEWELVQQQLDAVGEDLEPRPDDEAEVAEESDYGTGLVEVETMDRPRHEAAAAAASSGLIGLVDGPVDGDPDDGRRPWWSYNERKNEMVVGAEGYNPMQIWTAIARALSSELTLDKVLTEERLGTDLRHLETSDRKLLRKARCIGWLPDDATAEDLRQNLREARESLLDKAGKASPYWRDDTEESSSEVLSKAQGLAGTMVHLLDLLDVEVVREVQIPDYTSNFATESKRRSLAKTIAFGAAIQSRYGHYAAFRQLLEDRPKKRDQKLEPRDLETDAAGQLIGSIVLKGRGIESLEDELERQVKAPKDLHPDAPDIGIPIPIEMAGREATARATARLLETKNMRPTQLAVDLLHGFTSDVYAVTTGLYRGLAHEEFRREIYIDEVKRALGFVGDDQLLDGEPSCARRGVKELMRADEPLSQAEIAERAGFTTQSWRNNKDGLSEAGIIEEVDGGWRVCLPYSSERDEPVEQHLPWYLQEEPDDREVMAPELRRPTDVLTEVALELAGDSLSVSDEPDGPIERFLASPEWPPPAGVIDGVLEELSLGSVWELIRARCGLTSDPEPPTPVIGSTPYIQRSLPAG